MKIPSSYVRLNGDRARIRLVANPRLDGGRVYGYHETETGTIVLRSSLHPAELRSALFHELLHEVLTPVHPVNRNEGIEEAIVRTIETNLLRLLDRNPELARVILEAP